MSFFKRGKLTGFILALLVNLGPAVNLSYAQDTPAEEKTTAEPAKSPVEKAVPAANDVPSRNVLKKTKTVNKTKAVSKAKAEPNYAFKPGKVYYRTHTVKAHENLYIIARKYGMRYRTLAAMNGAKSPYLVIGKKVILGKTIQPVGNIEDGIIVNIPEKKLYFFNAGKLVKEYGVAVGLPNPKWQTPVGDYRIVSKIKDPIWKIPVSIQKEMKENGQEVKKEVPAGPGNPLGKWWMGLTWTGLGIHSTTAPWSIGYSVSHGCIRMNPKTAEELFKLVKTSMPVRLAYQPVKISMDGSHKVFLEVHRNVYNKKLNSIAKAKEMLVHYKLDKNIDWKKVAQAAEMKTGEPVQISKS
jgi:L,D-transpeptidase ErfK/SrfK